MHALPRPPSRAGRIALLALVALAPVGCVGTVGSGPAGPGGATSPQDGLRLPPAGLRTLTPAQYAASVREVLGLAAEVEVRTVGQWSTTVAAARGGFSPTTVESYEAEARRVVDAVFADPARRSALLGCAPANVAGDACTVGTVERIGRRAFRRPLTAEESARWSQVALDLGARLGDADRGLALAISGLLQSPHFLYRVELGAPEPASARVRYRDHEIATRLAYLVWGSTPDEPLLDAADRGELATEQGLERELDRMLDDPRATLGLTTFLTELLEVDGLDDLEKDPSLFPSFPGMRDSMRAQMLADAIAATEAGGISALFTYRTTHVDAALAPLYGLDPASFGAELRAVETPPERAGILTTPGFLALHAYPGKSSPALRGLTVRKRLLCQDIAPPPPGVDTRLPETDEGRLVTTRELVAVHQQEPSCGACHRLMDPIGLGLEHFDAMGGHRLRENDLPIDPSGELDGAPFADAIELGEVIAEHPMLLPCTASRLHAHAVGSTIDPTDPAVAAIVDPRGDLRAMLRAIVMSPSFRYAWATPGTGGSR